MPSRMLAPLFLLLLSGCASLTPPAVGDPARGLEVVRKWCAQCHAVDGTPPPKSQAPLFVDVASRQDHDQARIRAFLDEDHFPMTTFRLLPDEKDDVAAFLASLKK